MLKANPPNLHANLVYISTFRRQNKVLQRTCAYPPVPASLTSIDWQLGGEAGYFLMSVTSAVSFLETASASSFSITPEDFEALRRRRLEAYASQSHEAEFSASVEEVAAQVAQERAQYCRLVALAPRSERTSWPGTGGAVDSASRRCGSESAALGSPPLSCREDMAAGAAGVAAGAAAADGAHEALRRLRSVAKKLSSPVRCVDAPVVTVGSVGAACSGLWHSCLTLARARWHRGSGTRVACDSRVVSCGKCQWKRCRSC